MTDRVLLFDFKDTFDTIAHIGRILDEKTFEVRVEGVPLPIHVKRLSKTEMEAFEQKWQRLVIPPRGSAEPSKEDTDKREREQLDFFDKAIRDCITLDEGLVRDRDAWVTTGAGLIEVFHARKDVLGTLLACIYTENSLGSLLGKNLRSPRASGTGSAPSTVTRGGDAPEQTADRVEPLSIAAPEAATALSR